MSTENSQSNLIISRYTITFTNNHRVQNNTSERNYLPTILCDHRRGHLWSSSGTFKAETAGCLWLIEVEAIQY